MFSGIIQAMGTVSSVEIREAKGRFVFAVPESFSDLELGESVAVNGVCLTAVAFANRAFTVDVSTETLARTNLGGLRAGGGVNLERSLTAAQKISGHFVQGHVDCVGAITQIDRRSGETLFRFAYPDGLDPYIVEKGSVAVDGISLTAFACAERQFTVSVIPFTLAHTNLGARKIGDQVNLECDMIGKYVYKACAAILGSAKGAGGVTPDFLRAHGFDAGRSE